jgi:signal transduction histidine kinase
MELTSRVVRSGNDVLLACLTGAAAAAVTAGVVVAVGPPAAHPALVTAARAFIVAVPAGVGAYALRAQGLRFGVLLLATAGVLLVTTLAESPHPVPYTAGRAAGFVTEAVIVALVLAFPSGRLERPDRLITAAAVAVAALAYMPRLVLVRSFEVPSPYTSCVRDCPPNAAFALGHQPGFAGMPLRLTGGLLVILVSIAVLVRLGRKVAAATPLERRMVRPAVPVVAARPALLSVALIARYVAEDAKAVQVLAWVLAFATPAVAIAFAAGIARRRAYTADALAGLSMRLARRLSPGALRDALASALDDESLRIVFSSPGPQPRWLDERGKEVPPPEADADHAVTGVYDRGEMIGAIVHDGGMRADPELMQATAALVTVALRDQRLAADAQAALEEVRRSRRLIALAVENERRRFERDLHDSAQQRLVALRIELDQAQEEVRHDPGRAADRLAELQVEVDEALAELRSLAHGVYPPALAAGGVLMGVRAAALGSPLPVELEGDEMGRFSPEIESAVYYCILEAIQNASKHAVGASGVVVRLGADETYLRFAVVDDGDVGSAAALDEGFGIASMRQRIAAVDGELVIRRIPGTGTDVRGRVPLQPAPDLAVA